VDGTPVDPGTLPEPQPELPSWRRRPYRVFFPLGVLLAWAGVLHWLLHGTGVLADYRPVFHSIVQIQGFLMCFALGFLLTAIPRRTETAPPAAWQMVLGIAAPVATVICAWLGWFGLSQLFWLALVIMLIFFAAGRFRSGNASRRPPNSFVWIPLSLGMGVAGSSMIGAYGLLGDEHYGLHELGRLLLLQGMFLGLVVGAGGMVLPLLTRKAGSTDAADTPGHRLARAGHVLAALMLAGSFWLERSVSLRGGLAFRAALLAWLLVYVAGIWRLPSVAGWHRRLLWLSAWMLPLGYTLAALFPAQKKAGLHVAFIGGLAMMALSVGLHVGLAHGGHERLVRGRPWQVPFYGALLLVSALLRGLMDFDPERFFTWMAVSAGAFLLGTLFWAGLALPRMWRDAGR
jgi:uncharacterized protein involved in response to NO